MRAVTSSFTWQYYERNYRPQSYHIIQELQKYNMQDRRPRMAEFQRSIRKVRATQRMRRATKGFAFSQTEGQTRLIRQYDTTVQRPSGL